MNYITPGLPVHHQLPESTQIHVHWVGDAIQPSHPLSSLLLLPSIPPSIRVFSNESTLRIRWPKYWSFSFSISPSNEYSGLISFRMDWLDLPAVQGTLKSLLQHHSSKASILWCSAFFTVQLSPPYMTTGKTTAWFVTQHEKLMCCAASRLQRPLTVQHTQNCGFADMSYFISMFSLISQSSQIEHISSLEYSTLQRTCYPNPHLWLVCT